HGGYHPLGSSVVSAGSRRKRCVFRGKGANAVPKRPSHLGNPGLSSAVWPDGRLPDSTLLPGRTGRPSGVPLAGLPKNVCQCCSTTVLPPVAGEPGGKGAAGGCDCGI